jgi:hypothetical protein
MIWFDVSVRAVSGILIIALVLVWWRVVADLYDRFWCRSVRPSVNDDGEDAPQEPSKPSTWRFVGIGAVTFVLSQVVHIPLNAWVLHPLTKKLIDPATDYPVSALATWALGTIFGE